MAIDRASGRANNNRNDAAWKRTSVYGLPQMAFHHLIGWETLRDTWNKLLSISDRTSGETRPSNLVDKRRREIVQAAGSKTPDPAKLDAAEKLAKTQQPFLRQFLEASTDRSQGHALDCLIAYLQLIGYTRNEATTILGDILEVRSGYAETTTKFDRDDLGSRMTWTGWNLIEGPEGNVRSDDDQDGYIFDDFEGALEMTGRSMELAIARQAKQLNILMQSFITKRKVLKELYLKGKGDESDAEMTATLGSITALTTYMKSMLNGNPPNPNVLLVKWDPNMWIKLDRPPKPGRPWCKMTPEYMVMSAMTKGLANIKALEAAIRH